MAKVLTSGSRAATSLRSLSSLQFNRSKWLSHVFSMRMYHVLRTQQCLNLSWNGLSQRCAGLQCVNATSATGLRLISQDNSLTSPSTESVNTLDSNLTVGYLPEPPGAVSEVVEQLNRLGEPTMSSLGLGSYFPPGIIQQLLEYIHVTADMPWYAAIICLTFTIRIAAMPISIMMLKNAANMHNHQPTMMRLQKAQMEAMQANNTGLAMKLKEESTAYMKRNDCHPIKLVAKPLVMAPIFISVFSGIRGMTSLPVESMITGGMSWCANLTIPDPYFILPALSAGTLYLSTKLGAEGTSLEALSPGMRKIILAMPVLVFLFTAYQPAALALYWTTSNIISVTSSKIFQLPKISARLGIPEKVVHPKEDLEETQSTMDPFRQYKDLVEKMHEMEDRKKVDALHIKETDSQSPDEQMEDQKVGKVKVYRRRSDHDS